MSALYNPKENCIFTHFTVRLNTPPSPLTCTSRRLQIIIDMFLWWYLMYYYYFDLRFREVYLKMSFNLKEN